MRRGVVVGLLLASLLRAAIAYAWWRWWRYDGKGRQGEQARYW